MAGPFAEFQVEEIEPDDSDPWFTLAGKKLRCLPYLPAKAWLQTGSGFLNVEQAHAFILDCLVEEDEPVFEGLLANKRLRIDREMVFAITNGIIAAHTEVPTAPASESSNGHGSIGGGSEVGSSVTTSASPT